MKVMTAVAPLSMRRLVEVVNGWATTARAAAGIEDEPYPSLDLLSEPGAATATDGRHEQVAAIADRLHPVFAGATTSARLDALNHAIAGVAPLPVATGEGQRWRIADPGDRLEASLVMALAEHARGDPALDRLGVCAERRCADAFVDTTQARSRRYCSITCQNRVKARAHRRRQGE